MASDTEPNGETVLHLLGLEEWQGEVVVGRGIRTDENASTHEALKVVRSYINTLSDELAAMQQAWDDHLAEERRLDAGLMLTEADAPQLQRKLREVHAAREVALERGERLATERDEAFAMQTETELALREAKNALQEVRREMRHKDLEMREANGPSTMRDARDLSSGTLVLADSDEEEHDGYFGEISPLETFSGGKFNRADTLVALQASQEELKLIRQKRIALEQKAVQGREKLHNLMSDAERQKDELRILRNKYKSSSKCRALSEPRFDSSALSSIMS